MLVSNCVFFPYSRIMEVKGVQNKEKIKQQVGSTSKYAVQVVMVVTHLHLGTSRQRHS